MGPATSVLLVSDNGKAAVAVSCAVSLTASAKVGVVGERAWERVATLAEVPQCPFPCCGVGSAVAVSWTVCCDWAAVGQVGEEICKRVVTLAGFSHCPFF
jgi:hypothetical protein